MTNLCSLLIGRRGFHRWLAPTLKEMKRRKDKMGPEQPTHRKEFIEWNYDAELYAFGKRIGEEFKKSLLIQALTEKSYIVQEEKRQKDVGIEPNLMLEDNDVLIEKGEHIITRYVDNYLSRTLPRLPGSCRRSIQEYLVADETLAHIGKNIGLDDLMLCSDFPIQDVTLARGVKSIIQALALSSGEERANNFVRDFIVTQLAGKDLTPFCSPINPLESLEEIYNKAGQTVPEPRLIGLAGPKSLLAAYHIGIYAERKLIGTGFGESVETAKQMAACDALWRLWGVTQDRRPFNFSLVLPPNSKETGVTSLL